jgi:hypothetical protein
LLGTVSDIVVLDKGLLSGVMEFPDWKSLKRLIKFGQEPLSATG